MLLQNSKNIFKNIFQCLDVQECALMLQNALLALRWPFCIFSILTYQAENLKLIMILSQVGQLRLIF